MMNAPRIRAFKIAIDIMGPRSGIEKQGWEVIIGRSCSAGQSALPDKDAQFESQLIFDHQDDISLNDWKVQIQEDQDPMAARLVDLYGDRPLWPHDDDPLWPY